jgi:hypothetical protein
MAELLNQLYAISPGQIRPPSELEAFYQWVENNGLIEEYDDGFVYGRISADWEETPDVTLTASYQSGLKYWFGIPEVTSEILSRLVIFARSGMDGSMLGMWLDDNDELKFVHLGSGSGSMLCCVIANNAIDFLSLLSVGYNELGFVYDFTLSPDEIGDEPKVNKNFIGWLKARFNIVRPSNGSQFVKTPAEIGNETTTDPFCLWCNEQSSKQ